VKVLKPVFVFVFLTALGLPLFFTVLISFVENHPLREIFLKFPQLPWTFENYQRVTNSQSVEILIATFRMAIINAFLTVSMGYVVARFVSNLSKARQGLILLLFLSPFLVNSVVRLLSFQNFIGVQGPLQKLIRLFNPEFADLTWSHNLFSMHIGFMLQYLPFAILPLYLGFQKWDIGLREAAQDLGASNWQIFSKIEWPWMKPWLLTATLIVLIPSFGEYVIPEILMGSKELVWGQYISEAFLKWRNAPLGAALGTVMILLLALASLKPIQRQGLK
jgi:spermidine/putrescine transport system permease protein